jgi:hypothetical protein
MSTLSIAFRVPDEGRWLRAVLESDHRLSRGRLSIEGEEAIPLVPLSQEVTGSYHGRTLSLSVEGGEIELAVDGERALREDRLSAPTSRSAWIHAFTALLASVAGFVASWLYLVRAEAGDAWALKMAIHMAGWHLLLVLTLFPASVWGQLFGIRAVQLASAIFFLIHAGIALANVSAPFDGIALFNALSGLGFAIAVGYGQTAHRDMDPLRALS